MSGSQPPPAPRRLQKSFFSATFPENETTIIKPPIGCLFIKPNKLWLLNKNLYVLQRILYHFFDKLTSTLRDIGKPTSPYNPCLYNKNFTPGGSPICIGIYIEDSVYLKQLGSVGQQFRDALFVILQVYWQVYADWFLVKFFE